MASQRKSGRGGARVVSTGGATPAIMIEKHTVALLLEERPLERVRLDPENPRIRHLVAARDAKSPPTERELRDMILALDGVSSLQRSIRENGGLQEPIYVLEDGLVVEGNCRTAVFLKLSEAASGAETWSTIPAYVLPKGTNKRDIAVLQGICHVAGKKRWDAYEKAGHVHRMRHDIGMTELAIQDALGMSSQDVLTLLRAYATMNALVLPVLKASGARPGDAVRKYSYVAEFHKRKEFASFRAKKENEKLFVEIITADPPKLTNGQQVRQLHKVLEHEEARKVLLSKKGTFAEALKVLDDPVVASSAFRLIEKATRTLKGLQQAELEQLRREKKAQSLLTDLHQAVLEAARFSGVSLARKGSP